MGRKRQKANNRFVAGEPKNQSSQIWLKGLRYLFFTSGWLAAVFVGLLELPARLNSFANNYNSAKETTLNAVFDYQKYVGRFSSDPNAWAERNLLGDGTHPPDDGEIQLNLEYLGDGKYEGEIYSAYMGKHSLAPWSKAMVDGVVGISGAFTGVVWDIVSNSRTPYASFRLSQEDKLKGSLRLMPTFANNIFSGEIVLWPTDFEMSRGERGPRFGDLLLGVITDQQKNNENGKNVEK